METFGNKVISIEFSQEQIGEILADKALQRAGEMNEIKSYSVEFKVIDRNNIKACISLYDKSLADRGLKKIT